MLALPEQAPQDTTSGDPATTSTSYLGTLPRAPTTHWSQTHATRDAHSAQCAATASPSAASAAERPAAAGRGSESAPPQAMCRPALPPPAPPTPSDPNLHSAAPPPPAPSAGPHSAAAAQLEALPVLAVETHPHGDGDGDGVLLRSPASPPAERALRRTPTLGHPGAHKRVLLLGGVVRVAEPGAAVPAAAGALCERMAALRHVAGGRCCVCTDPDFPAHASAAAYHVACLVLGDGAALMQARRMGLVRDLGRVIQDAFAVSRYPRLEREHRGALAALVDGLWQLLWLLLAAAPACVAEDLAAARMTDWLVLQVLNQRDPSARAWSAYLVNRLSSYMHVTANVLASFIANYPLLLATDPLAWGSPQEQAFLLRLTHAVMERDGCVGLAPHVAPMAGFCCRIVRLERRRAAAMRALLEYLVVAIMLNQLARTEAGRASFARKDVKMALEEIVDNTRSREVHSAASALLSLQLYEAECMADHPWWSEATQIGA